MAERPRHRWMAFLVFLVPAAFVVLLGLLPPGISAGLLRPAAGRYVWPPVAMLVGLLALSVAMFAFLRVHHRPRLVAICLAISALMHLLLLILSGHWALRSTPEEVLRPEKRHRLSAGLPSRTETMVGQEVREKLLETPDPEARPIAEKKAPRQVEPEPVQPKAHAELLEVKREAPSRQVAEVEPASKPKNEIEAALKERAQFREDALAAKLVAMQAIKNREIESAPKERSDTRRMELTQAGQPPVKLREPELKLQPAEGQTIRREPMRRKPEQVPAVASSKPAVAESLTPMSVEAPVDNLDVPAARVSRRFEPPEPKSSPQPQQVELPRRRVAPAEKPLRIVSAPEKPAEIMQPTDASLMKEETSARPAKALLPAEPSSMSGARQADSEKPVKLRDRITAITGPNDAASGPKVAPARPKSLKQDRAMTAAVAEKDLGGRPRVAVGSAERSPSQTLAARMYETRVRRGAVAPVIDERMESSSTSDKPLPLTPAVGSRMATLAGAAEGGVQHATPAGPAAINAARVRTGLAEADVPVASLRPTTEEGVSNSISGARDSTLVEPMNPEGGSVPRVPSELDTGLTAGSTAVAAGMQPIEPVGVVSGVARTDTTGGERESAARTPSQRGALFAKRAAGSTGRSVIEGARPSRDISTGTVAKERSLAGRSVPAGSSRASAEMAESIAPASASEGDLAAGDVGLTSLRVTARTDTAGASAGSGTGTEPNRPANVTFARAGRASGAPERAERFSAPLESTGGGPRPAEQLVTDSGEPASSAVGPEMASATSWPAPVAARNSDSMPVVFSVPRVGPAGGRGSKSLAEKGRVPTDGVGQMMAVKAAGGRADGAATADQLRREAPSAGGGVDRAPARLDVAFDQDSAASGHVRTEGPAEAVRQSSSRGSPKALLSVGTAPMPDSVPEKAIYQMRKPEKRKEFIIELGGTPETENAVERGLAWLARAQSDDGRWDLRAFKTLRECGGAGDLATEDPAMTGLVLLSFLGAGYTHTEGAYKDNVRKGLEWIMSGQTDAGDLRGGGTMYGQAIAATALCESYSLTGDDRLMGPARRAIDFILKAQNPEAGWRYQTRDDNDTSVTGWQILALKSAQIAGMEIPQEHFKWTGMWLDKVRKGKEGGLYCYKSGHAVTPVMTAEGWFCQLFMSEKSRARGQAESIGYLMGNLPAWSPGDRAVHLYYWYYATLSLYLSGCSEFQQWNEALRTALLKGEVKDGPAAGSWDPVDQLGPRGGRVYTTAVATLCLEVYYRFLPIYKMPKVSQGK